MILLWTTKPKNPMSKLIRWGLDEPMSHFATAFFPFKTGLVLEQQMTKGFEITDFEYFISQNSIVHALMPKESMFDDEDILMGLMEEFSGSKYDDGSFLYLCWRVILLKLFQEPFPKNGEWGDTTDPLCTGHARIIQRLRPEWFTKEISDFDITSPGSLYENMLRSGHFKIVTAEMTGA